MKAKHRSKRGRTRGVSPSTRGTTKGGRGATTVRAAKRQGGLITSAVITRAGVRTKKIARPIDRDAAMRDLLRTRWSHVRQIVNGVHVTYNADVAKWAKMIGRIERAFRGAMGNLEQLTHMAR